MKFAVGMGRNEPVTEVAGLARAAEDAGFAFVTFVDQPGMSPDVNVCMTAAAIGTSHIRIGQGVADPSTHRPWVIANSAATLNELSGGRQLIGLGAGGPFGKDMKARPLAEVRQAIEFLRRFMSGQDATFDGLTMRSEWIRTPVPIYVGGAGPKLLQLAGELADGVMLASNADPVHVQWQLEQIYRGAERVGRDPGEVDVWARGMIYVTDSLEASRTEVGGYAVNSACGYGKLFERPGAEIDELRRRVNRAYPGLIEECYRVRAVWTPDQHERIGTPAASAVTQRIIDVQHLAGTRDEILAKIGKLAKIGIDTFATVTYTIKDKKEMIQTIGSEVISAC
jgi:5,10-methylenetetrahydromethanopterin reductase